MEYHIITWRVRTGESKKNWGKVKDEVRRGADSSYISHLRAWLVTRGTVDRLERFFGASATGINRGKVVVDSLKWGSRSDCLAWAEMQRDPASEAAR